MGTPPGMGENPFIITLNDGVTFLGPCETLISSCKPVFLLLMVFDGDTQVVSFRDGIQAMKLAPCEDEVFMLFVDQVSSKQLPRIEGSKIPSPNGHRNRGKISRKF